MQGRGRSASQHGGTSWSMNTGKSDFQGGGGQMGGGGVSMHRNGEENR